MIENRELAIDQFKVAVLTSQIHYGQDISKSLRKYGLYAFYYEKLSELWNLLNSERIHWVIADIGQLNESGLSLLAHPTVQAEQSLITVFYDGVTKGLMSVFSNQESANYLGVIDGDIPIDFQIRANIRQVTELISTRSKAQLQEKQVSFFKDNNKTLIEEKSDLQKTVQIYDDVSEFANYFEQRQCRDQQSFLEILARFLDEWKIVDSFSFYHLNHSGEKLISGDLPQFKKFEKLPLLWAGKACTNGIEHFLQQMCLQVAFDQFGTNLVLLKVKGFQTSPDICVFLELKKSVTIDRNGVYWSLLELVLNNHYKAAVREEEKVDEEADHFIPAWDAVELILHNSKYESDTGHKLVNIDLRSLNKFVLSQNKNEFKWRAFFSDFLLKLNERLQGKFKISHLGTTEVMCFISNNLFESNYMVIKKVIGEFEYWNYFENQNIIFNKLYYPAISIVPPNLGHYFKKYIFAGSNGDSVSGQSRGQKHSTLIRPFDESSL